MNPHNNLLRLMVAKSFADKTSTGTTSTIKPQFCTSKFDNNHGDEVNPIFFFNGEPVAFVQTDSSEGAMMPLCEESCLA